MRPLAKARGTARHDAGFTLLELLVAVALMAILAVLSWRGLDSVLSSRESITGRSEQLRSLVVAFAQIDDDLRRTWPVRLMALQQPGISFARESDAEGYSLVMLREAGSVLGLQRVIYRLRAGVLERGFEPWNRAGVQGGVDLSLQTLTWQPILTEVESLEYRAWIPFRGWIAGGGPVGGTEPVSGLEVTVQHKGERLVRVFAVKD